MVVVGCVRRSVKALTVGAVWLCARFVTLKVNVYRVLATVSAASTSTSVPELLVQLPFVGSGDCDEGFPMGRLELSGVTVPVKPASVTIGLPAAAAALDLQVDKSGTFGCSCTVIVLGAQGHGVLWLAVRTIQLRADTYKGPPPATFETVVAAVVKGAGNMDSICAACEACPFTRTNETEYVVPAIAVLIELKTSSDLE